MNELWAFAPKIALVLLWLVTLLRLPLWRDPRQRVLNLVFVCFAMAETVVLERTRAAFDALGVRDLWTLVANLVSLLGVVLLLKMAVVAYKPAFVRGVWAFCLSGMTCITAAFLAVPQVAPFYKIWDEQHPAVLAYRLINIACLVVALCIVFAILFPQWRSARPGPLRKALLLLWSSVVTALCYCACITWYVVAQGFELAEWGRTPQYFQMPELLLYLALLLGGIGGLVRAVRRWRGQLVRYRTYYRLDRLWTQLTDVVPSVVLEPPPRVVLSSLELRLFRRAVEIRDAQVELVGLVSSELREEARIALGGKDLDACTLLMALRLKEDGAAHPENPVELTWSAEVSLDGELKSLLALDRAMRSPAVVEAAGRALRSAGLPDAQESRAVGGNLRADRA